METKRALIGLTGNFRQDQNEQVLAAAYTQAVVESGAVPVVLSPLTPLEQLDSLLDRLDGLVFTGGGDFTEALVGEPLHEKAAYLNPVRDAFEAPLIRKAMARQMPVLGICRGAQLLNLAMGGSLYQDLPSQYVPAPPAVFTEQHSQQADRDQTTHGVALLPDTLLSKLFGGVATLEVNSFHHQAIRQVPDGLRVAAISPEGVVEAVESARYQPFVGVQWHPECLIHTRPEMGRLFGWLRDEALLYRRAREIQASAVSLDAHTDAPMFFDGHFDICHGGWIERGKIDFDAQGEERLERVDNRVDFDKMQTAGLDSVVMAAYIKQLERTPEGLQAAARKAERLLDETIERTRQYGDRAEVARTAEDIVRLKKQGKKAVLLGIENAYALGLDLANVDRFADKGIVYMTLSHNGHNDVCDSASQQDRPEHNGVSVFGRQVIEALNRRGVMVDLSHASEKSFYDALAISKAPVICSHSSVWNLCPHRRNLKDEQIRALAAKGGVMGICLYDGFLSKEHPADLTDIVRHIDYVRRLVGIDYVGIGSDFDGGGGVCGCNDTAQLFAITRELLRLGYCEEEIAKVLGGNFLRVMHTVKSFAYEK